MNRAHASSLRSRFPWMRRGAFAVLPSAALLACDEAPTKPGAMPVEELSVQTQSQQGDKEALLALYRKLSGQNWFLREPWDPEKPIETWDGVEVNEDGRVRELLLTGRGLDGRLPPEIGWLDQLERLSFAFNGDLVGPYPREFFELEKLSYLSLQFAGMGGPLQPEFGELRSLDTLFLHASGLGGHLPAELGQLEQLRELTLYGNDIVGPIPPEMGNLVELRNLSFWNNHMTGAIPAEMGNLDKVVVIDFDTNEFTGPVPGELGGMDSLRVLWLNNNRLTGSIPGGLGSLDSLIFGYFENNDFEGPLPKELGNLGALTWLSLGNNPKLSGSIPPEWAGMDSLSYLNATNTQLCAPASDAPHREWLDGVRSVRLSACETAASVYLTQAVQSIRYPVPLVAGEPALLRVFVHSSAAAGEPMPPVRADFFLNGSVVHSADIPGGQGVVGAEIDEGSMDGSANVEVSGEWIQPGLEMVVEVDPDGATRSELNLGRRVPDQGRMRVDVRELPPLKITFVPMINRNEPDSAIVDLTAGMVKDPKTHPMMEAVNKLLPRHEFEMTLHSPVETNDFFGFGAMLETLALRALEGGEGYWVAMMTPMVRFGLLGVAADIPSWVSFSRPDPFTLAHEIGHNMGLYHAPCGGAGGPDPLFPDENGRTGAWGYDASDGSLVSPYIPDLMSYCSRQWIGDYHFSNMVRHRITAETEASPPAAKVNSVLIWGGINQEGELFLEPAFEARAKPLLPSPVSGRGDVYRLSGRDAGGREAFSLRFNAPQTQDLKGKGSVFAFVVPKTWTGSLSRISLSGKGGRAVLDENTDRPMTILRDADTGEVRGFVRHGPGAAPEPAGPGLRSMFSRGLPGASPEGGR